MSYNTKEKQLAENFSDPMLRSVSALCSINADHIYVYFKDKETFDRFCKTSMSENLRCGKQELNYTDIIALQHDGTAVYCNSVSRIAFGAGDGITDNIVRIDFQRYINGKEDFFYRKN